MLLLVITRILLILYLYFQRIFLSLSCTGWRAMFADAGFANALNRAGISFDNTGAAADASVPTITGISSTSGGTWFSTQFFYSLDFYEKVLVENPDDLHDFVMLWMDSYLSLTESIVQANSSLCSLGGPRDSKLFDLGSNEDDDAPLPGEPMQWCILFRYYQGDWAEFMVDMFLHASRAYETNDDNATEPFPYRNAGIEERHAALQNTDMIVQTSLSPMSRVSIGGSLRHVYLGDNAEGGDSYFSTVLPTAYTVSSVTRTSQFHIGNWTEDELVTYVDVDGEHDTYSIEEYDGYNLYQGQDTRSGNINPGRTLFTSDIPSVGTPKSSGSFSVPFSSTSIPPKTGQIASISSAALGSISGLNPAELSQLMSKQLYGIQTDDTLTLAESKKKQAELEKSLDWLYGADGLWGVSVCTQWPNDCGPNDSRFSDGAYTGKSNKSHGRG